jgi:hypothetical protein
MYITNRKWLLLSLTAKIRGQEDFRKRGEFKAHFHVLIIM